MPDVAQYVGVAATSRPDEIEALLAILDGMPWPGHARLMNGPLVSRKTLRGLVPDDPAQYPPIERVASLLVDDPRLYNVVHFNSRDPRLFDQMSEITERCGRGRLDGFQLNILWPGVDQLEMFRARYPEVSIILQLSRHCLDSVGGSLDAVVDCLSSYERVVDCVLFDPSGGLGLPFDSCQASSLLDVLVASALSMRWGVTGGLSAASAPRLAPLLRQYSHLCWDAQSGLRTEDGLNALDMKKCQQFLESSIKILM